MEGEYHSTIRQLMTAEVLCIVHSTATIRYCQSHRHYRSHRSSVLLFMLLASRRRV